MKRKRREEKIGFDETNAAAIVAAWGRGEDLASPVPKAKRRYTRRAKTRAKIAYRAPLVTLPDGTKAVRYADFINAKRATEARTRDAVHEFFNAERDELTAAFSDSLAATRRAEGTAAAAAIWLTRALAALPPASMLRKDGSAFLTRNGFAAPATLVEGWQSEAERLAPRPLSRRTNVWLRFIGWLTR